MPLPFLPSLLLLLFLSISLLRRIRESGKIVIRFFDGFGWKEKTHYFVFFFSFLRRLVWTNLWTVLEKFLFASGIASNDYWSVTKGTRVSTSFVFFFLSLCLVYANSWTILQKKSCNSFQGLTAVGQLGRYATELYPCSTYARTYFSRTFPFLSFLSFSFFFLLGLHELVNHPGKIVLCTKLGPRL